MFFASLCGNGCNGRGLFQSDLLQLHFFLFIWPYFSVCHRLNLILLALFLLFIPAYLLIHQFLNSLFTVHVLFSFTLYLFFFLYSILIVILRMTEYVSCYLILLQIIYGEITKFNSTMFNLNMARYNVITFVFIIKKRTNNDCISVLFF